MRSLRTFLSILIPCLLSVSASAGDIKKTKLYERIKRAIDAVPAIDTHEHLRGFSELPNQVETSRGRGMTLQSIWSSSYFTRIHRVSPWPETGEFDDWWHQARHDFDNAHATSLYRYMLPAFRDLYGVDFDTVTTDQARKLNDQIFDHYRDDEWLLDVVTRRANIELMLIDPYWARLTFKKEYKFSVPVLNVTTIMRGSHAEQFDSPLDSPFEFAKARGLKTGTFDDFLNVINVIFQEAVASDCVCLKSTQAYQRDLSYRKIPKTRAEEVYGKSPDVITDDEQRDFEDFMFWHVCRLSAEFELPFQVHTGDARIQGSNPMRLVDTIAANPNTKFILFHGGYPWIGETAAIAMKYRNVWIDSCWLPTMNYTVARRAYQEWLDVVPSDRIMWGADTVNAEGIYAATEFTRQCLAEALAEKVERGELREEHANQIGAQIMRNNALKLFPKLNRMLWMQGIQESDSQSSTHRIPAFQTFPEP